MNPKTQSLMSSILIPRFHPGAKWYSWVISFSLGILGAALTGMPALGANQVIASYSPMEIYVSVKSLENFAKTGEISSDLLLYTSFLKPEELEDLRQVLQQKFEVRSNTIELFINSPTGEAILKGLGAVFKTEDSQNGFAALKIALNQSLNGSEGLTIVNLLRQFPSNSIRVDLKYSAEVVEKASEFIVENQSIFTAIQNQAAAEVTHHPPVTHLPDLRQPGRFRWQKETLEFVNPNRDRKSPADIYFPIGKPSAPVIVISHGLGSDRGTFAYLAEHLASQGFAVAVPEHIDTSSDGLKRVFGGFDRPQGPAPFINRPQDITFLLNELEQKTQSDPRWRGRLNLQNVGVVGQSLGGYTVLALSGATLNFAGLNQVCEAGEPKALTFNPSFLLECLIAELPPNPYPLQDPRIKAVIAINPVSGEAFGQSGMSQIKVPVMMIAGTQDAFAPAVPEQIYPFTWLTTPDKYLVLTQPGTHFSFLEGDESVFPIPPDLIGPDPAQAFPYLKMLSTAFFNAYLQHQTAALNYLNQSYLNSIQQGPFNLSLIQSFQKYQEPRNSKEATEINTIP